MKDLTMRTLLRKIQREINTIQKLDTETHDSKEMKMLIDKARTLGYLISVASQILEKHELEKRIEHIEKAIEEMKGHK